MFIDTHCHIHSAQFDFNIQEVLKESRAVGVEKCILIGEDAEDSRLAIEVSAGYDGLFATVGLHPHQASLKADLSELTALVRHETVVGIGECGLDYWYQHSSREDQLAALEYQIELAVSNQLPISFHVRGSKANPIDAFEDFFAVIDSRKNSGQSIRGVIHSFSSGQAQLEGVLSRGLHVGLNGIATFADSATQEVIKTVPLDSMVLETDAPFLTPVPKRGTVNTPKNIVFTAEHIAKQQGISIEELAQITTSNANQLFTLEV
jgi:TatD DNase family protein